METRAQEECLDIRVEGIVQGVGFRPFVCNLARRLGLKGSVANTGTGVRICISGTLAQTRKFLTILEGSPPPLAQIFNIQVSESGDCPNFSTFTIAKSRVHTSRTTLISPDTATCAMCVRDILEPHNRRYDYPFTNCTDCGPRLTIIRQIPYDRRYTSMSRFTMCPLCNREYHDPSDRRFHAQPNACPECGPTLEWRDSSGDTLIASDNSRCMDQCARALKHGAIVAIKGLGGFHLAVDAASSTAVSTLRDRKRRKDKPLAIMAADMDTAEQVAYIHREERKLLLSRQCPIVLCKRKENSAVCQEVAPGIDQLGVMLPYTPLHHLLFARPECPRTIVMTSGNISQEPICTDNAEAIERLGRIADYFLMHNRQIVTRVDDSVVRIVRSRPQIIRRSRGYVPAPVMAEGLSGSLLACGAEKKNTFCLSRGTQLFPSQHIGDLKGPDALAFFEESVEHLQKVLDIRVDSVACDMHPDYLSSRFATSLNLPCARIQHHHAHAAAVMAEHNISEAIAVVYDGSGLGTDGTIWGGEILHCRNTDFRRVAHLAPMLLPGGDQATGQIWRMGLALLSACGYDITGRQGLPPAIMQIDHHLRTNIAALMGKRINCPATSSVGRLFDAIASMAGIRQEAHFEAQAAMELESQAWQARGEQPPEERYTATVTEQNGRYIIDFRPVVAWIMEDMANHTPAGVIAMWFHIWLASSTALVLRKLHRDTGIHTVILAGGCFQNRLLMELLADTIETSGLTVHTGEQVPVNDGGIAVGQIFLAAPRQQKTDHRRM